MEGERVTHCVLQSRSVRLIGLAANREKLTDVQIWNEMVHGFPCKHDGPEALTEQSETWPCRVFDEMTLAEEDKIERFRGQFNVES